MAVKFHVFILIALFSPHAFGAEILKSTNRMALIQFDPLAENFVIGDRLVVSSDDKAEALLEITKIKGVKFLARVLYGTASPGMKLKKFGVVTPEVKPVATSANLESVTIRFYSNTLIRGIPYNIPYLAAAIEYLNEGLLATLNTSNTVAPGTSEIDFYLGYALNRPNWTITPMIATYTYTGMHSWDTYDFMLNLTYGVFSIDASYIPKYFSARSSDLNFALSALVGLGDRWKISPRISHSQFSDETAVEFKNYLDYKIGFLYSSEFAVEFAWVGTNRKDLNGKSFMDDTGLVMISKRF